MKHRDDSGVHLAAHVGATDPSLDAELSVRPGIFWVDTTDGESSAVLKFRNAADDGWVTLLGGGLPSGAVTVGGEVLTAGGDVVTAGA